MKIKPDDYLGLGFTRRDNTFRNTVLMSMLSSLGDGIKDAGIDWTPELMRHRKAFTERILSVTGWNHYLLTEKAVEIASRIKVEKDFNYGLLRTLRAQQSCYLLGKDEFFRFYVEPTGQQVDDGLKGITNANFSGITIMHMRADHSDKTVSRTSFNIDYEKGIQTNERLSAYHWELAQRLLRLIIFVEMSEPEILVVEHGATRKNPAKPWEAPVKNLSGVAITRVHSDWNKFIIHTAEIGVKGFLRLQACGPQWSQRRLVWVKDFVRKGFVRRNKGATSLS